MSTVNQPFNDLAFNKFNLRLKSFTSTCFFSRLILYKIISKNFNNKLLIASPENNVVGGVAFNSLTALLLHIRFDEYLIYKCILLCELRLGAVSLLIQKKSPQIWQTIIFDAGPAWNQH